ncbi:MAG: hypothetical protein IPM74_15440 [Crocinitomicaceae bacterium]|nr:hypothetical protein [Crocinitomicaceae bacterium]MBK8927263.1 hypothetical protein [Crocinitomicaceae bacterium]
MRRWSLIMVLCLSSVFVLSQEDTVRHGDVGLRFTTSEFNRIQVEFRFPAGTYSYLRLGTSMGFQYNYPGRDIFAANDSIVTTRQKDLYGNHYDLRFGFERQISYDWLCFHADAMVAYSSLTKRNWSYYHVLDSSGTDWKFEHTNPYSGVGQDSAMAVTSYIGAGVVLGLSFNFNITENFILNFTGNYAGVMRFGVSEKEQNDIYNEFDFAKSANFELFPTAGIGLRYVFKSNTEPVPTN